MIANLFVNLVEAEVVVCNITVSRVEWLQASASRLRAINKFGRASRRPTPDVRHVAVTLLERTVGRIDAKGDIVRGIYRWRDLVYVIDHNLLVRMYKGLLAWYFVT